MAIASRFKWAELVDLLAAIVAGRATVAGPSGLEHATGKNGGVMANFNRAQPAQSSTIATLATAGVGRTSSTGVGTILPVHTGNDSTSTASIDTSLSAYRTSTLNRQCRPVDSTAPAFVDRLAAFGPPANPSSGFITSDVATLTGKYER